MNASSIEWLAAEDGSAGFTWNPVTGCTKVSAGCAHCYAATWAARQMGHWSKRRFEDVRVHEHRLDGPLRRRKPARIFVNSMSDLFHDAVPEAFIDSVFAVMALAPRHTFIVLTKRAQRMRDYLQPGRTSPVIGRAWEMLGRLPKYDHQDVVVRPWPLPNVILGVSVEDQASADVRIPLLLDTPAACRAVSYEPALGPVDFGQWMWPVHDRWPARFRTPEDARAAGAVVHRDRQCFVSASARFLDWLIVGGEAGAGARPFDIAWARSAVAQCREARVPVFVKQLGSRPLMTLEDFHELPAVSAEWWHGTVALDDLPMREAQHDTPGIVRLLDRSGGDPNQWPADLRWREWPELLRPQVAPAVVAP